MGLTKNFSFILSFAVIVVGQAVVGQNITNTTTVNKADNVTSTMNSTLEVQFDATNKTMAPSTTKVLTTNTTTTKIPYVPFVARSVMTNCHIMPNDTDVTFKIKSLINAGAKIIKYHLHLEDEGVVLSKINESSMYRPLFWARTTGRQGRGILLLRPEYDMLSLTTLELGVHTLNVTLHDSPRHCLKTLNLTDIEQLFRELVMNDFQNTSSGSIVHLQPTHSVCNMHVINETGVAEFRYVCCNRSSTLHVECRILDTEPWLNVLLGVVTLIKILVLLFSPNWIPETVYRLRHNAVPFVFIPEPEDEFRLRTVVTKSPENYAKAQTVFKVSKFCNMTKFKATLQKMIPDVTYDFRLDKIELFLKQKRLLFSGCAPVGLFESMYDTVFKCKIRENHSVKACCAANVCLQCCTSRRFSWYRLLKEFMNIVMLVCFTLPWIIRVMIYYTHEHDEMNMRRDAAYARQLRFYFPGSMTLYLTPLHGLFVIMYLILSIESFVFGVLKKKTKEKLKFVMRKCFNDMQEFNKQTVIGWVVQILLLPFVSCGILGFLIGPIVWVVMVPILAIVLAFYLFPTVNLTGRLIAHFAVYFMPRELYTRCKFSSICSRLIESIESTLETRVDMKELAQSESLEKKESALRTTRGRFEQLIIIFFSLISLYSCIFLLTEFITFFVEIVVYTMIGIILNASATLTYISLGLYVIFYANDCISNVVKKFLSYSSTLNAYILGLGKSQAEPVYFRNFENQLNRAFRVKTGRPCEPKRPVCLVKNDENQPRWKFSKLVLFVTNRDQPQIPKKFYFDACRMPYSMVPGELFSSYISAFRELGMIIIFLIFVLIVVLAFGETYELSSTNHLLATIAGGFLPLMLRRVLFKTHSVPAINTSTDINFQVCIYDLLNSYEQCLPVADIDVGSGELITNMVKGFGSTNGLQDPITSDGEGTPVLEDTAINSKRSIDEQDNRNSYLDEGVTYDCVDADDNIDLVIDITNVDSDEFPNMFSNLPFDDREIGSTSFLDDVDEAVALSVV